MGFYEILDQILALLKSRGRVTYRALKRQFNLDDAFIEDLKEELLYAQHPIIEEDGRGLVWTEHTPPIERDQMPLSYTPPHLAEKILTSRSAMEGERKQVTVLFCDLAHSTALAAHLGPERMHTLLNRFFALALDEIHRYEGTVNQFLGDGFMALFGAPVAHEDHARRAVLAAIGLQQTLKGHHADLGEPYGVECTFRMGINTGLVVVGGIGDNLRMDYTAVGDTTNLAARLQQVADPGVTLISEATRRLVQDSVHLDALSPLHLKGMPDPVAAFKILGLNRPRSPLAHRSTRVLSHFVGRARELADLEALLAQVENGQGHVVGIVGEAGLGKSRLVHEFRQRLHGKRWTYLEGRCLSYGRAIPYLPLLDLLRHNCGITEADGPEVITAKVHLSLREVGMAPDEWTPYLLHLFAIQQGTELLAVLSPEAIKARTFEMIQQMSLHGSQCQPLIIAVEDLHWIDTTSEACFAMLAESLGSVPMLLLGTYRPGYRPPWIEQSNVTQIALRRLTPEDGLAVIRSILPQERLSDQLAQTILAKAEGNPFFLEELTQAVLESGDFRANIAVPDTIQGVLMARIDRLPEMSKRLLQTASVLGREFSLRLLEAIWEGPGRCEPLLLELKRLEFLYERIGAEEPSYVFKHALTQDVAYASLLTTRRQALHAATGAALERLYAVRLGDVYDRLAYHYARAQDAPKAVTYLTLFAEHVARGYAHVEAVTALQEALTHAQHLPEAERDRRTLELVLQLAHSLYFLGRFQEMLELLVQQQERLEQFHESSLAGPYAFWRSHALSYLGEYEQSVQWAQRAIEMAQQCGDEATMGKAYYVLARNGFWLCQFPEGIEYGGQAVTLLEHAGESWWLGLAHWAVGVNYTFMGELTSAWEPIARTQAMGDTLGDPRLQCYAAWSKGYTATFAGDWETGIAACQEGLTRSPDPVNTAIAMGFLGEAYLAKGEPTAALPWLEQAVQSMSQFRFRPLQSWYMTSLGEAHRLHGHLAQARELASQALTISQAIKFLLGVGFAQHALARIAQSEGTFTDAERYIYLAQQTYATIQSRYWVARTYLDLAMLAHAQGNQETAARHLQEAQAVFTTLQLPKYVEHTVHLAEACGVSLAKD
jgi:class 3 adenylate cyclase/tetratricopeptide (TPR) repeat protein